MYHCPGCASLRGIDFGPRLLGTDDRSPVLGSEKSRISGHYRSLKRMGTPPGRISRRSMSTSSERYIVSPRLGPGALPSLKSMTLMPTPATQLALHYLPKTRNPTEPLKYVVLLGYLGMVHLVVTTNPNTIRLMICLKAPWTAHPDQEIFVTSQRGLLGFARSTQPVLTLNGIRIATVQSTSPPGKQHALLPLQQSPFATTRDCQ